MEQTCPDHIPPQLLTIVTGLVRLILPGLDAMLMARETPTAAGHANVISQIETRSQPLGNPFLSIAIAGGLTWN